MKKVGLLFMMICFVVGVTFAESSPNRIFKVTIDSGMWSLWEFKYPVTYKFEMPGLASSQLTILYGDSVDGPWEDLVEKTSQDFFNGQNCYRFDDAEKMAYVSIGFETSNTFYLKFLNIDDVEYVGIAKYYDGRKAAFTLSNDNWGLKATANPGAVWQGMENDASDKYQASIHACRMYDVPISIAINTGAVGGAAMWQIMQDELDYQDNSWEPSIHSQTHPCYSSDWQNCISYEWEILGCRDEVLNNLASIPYGQHVFNFITPCGYPDHWGTNDPLFMETCAGNFLFLRAWGGTHHPDSTQYAQWDTTYNFYGLGGLETVSYDSVFQARSPGARYYAADVAFLNNAFDAVYNAGGIFYAMWHPDRYTNSVIYDTSTPVDGVSGSSFMQHLSHVSQRTDVWYVANGWLYSYRFVAENAEVASVPHCSSLLLADINDDCEVDYYDFVLLAEQWLDCGMVPVELCGF